MSLEHMLPVYEFVYRINNFDCIKQDWSESYVTFNWQTKTLLKPDFSL